MTLARHLADDPLVGNALNPTNSPEKIEQSVRLRADRQRRLTSETPLILRAVINKAECAMRWAVPT